MDGIMTDKDIVIGLLINQRNNLMNQITDLQLQIQKMAPFMPKAPDNDDKPQQ